MSEKKELSETVLKTFNSISVFVEDLSTVFERCRSISLFNKLIAGTTFRDHLAIERYIKAFKDFYQANPDFVTVKKISSPKIVYNDRIYIDVDWVMKHAGDNKDVIHSHLVTIYTVMNAGKKESLKALEILKEKANAENYLSKNEPDLAAELNLPDTKEGDFIKESLNGISALANEINLDSANANPAEMISTVMNSDFFKNFAQNMQTKFANGDINAQSLLQTVGAIVQQNGMGDQMEGMLSSMGGLSGLGGLSPQDNNNEK
jgi:hypothetical protein